MDLFLKSFLPALIVSLLIIAVLSLYMIMQRIKHEKFMHRVELDEIRRHYESQMYNLNNKMSANPERWKELNYLIMNPNISNSSDYFSEQNVVYSRFLKNMGIDPNDLEIVKDSVFVLTPFHKDMEETYEYIREICYKVGLRSFKSDEFVHNNNEIFPSIVKSIVSSRLIIANIDGRNPNVFYELGLAHALGKPTLMIAKSISSVPFDLQSKTVIIYNDYYDLKEKLSAALTKVIINN